MAWWTLWGGVIARRVWREFLRGQARGWRFKHPISPSLWPFSKNPRRRGGLSLLKTTLQYRAVWFFDVLTAVLGKTRTNLNRNCSFRLCRALFLVRRRCRGHLYSLVLPLFAGLSADRAQIHEFRVAGLLLSRRCCIIPLCALSRRTDVRCTSVGVCSVACTHAFVFGVLL